MLVAPLSATGTMPQIVVSGRRLRHGTETELVQRFIQQDTGMISRKRPARAIGTVHAGRESHDQQPRRRITERRNRPAVIIRVARIHLIEETGQPRAGPAIPVEDRWAIVLYIKALHETRKNAIVETPEAEQAGGQ